MTLIDYTRKRQVRLLTILVVIMSILLVVLTVAKIRG